MSNEHKIHTLTSDNFSKQVLEGSCPVLVDFWADWCAPCHRVAPHVEQLAQTYGGQLTVGKVNIDEEPELARSYGIRSIPAMLIFRDGEVVEQIVGAVPFKQLSTSVENVLAASSLTPDEVPGTADDACVASPAG